MSVKRYDRGSYGKPKKTPQGFLRADALLTRTGVFTYIRPDGTHFKELRLPEVVFAQDSLDSLSLAPVTDNHPEVFVDASNAREFARGAVGEKIIREGDFIRSSILVTDAACIKGIENGSQRELSCGYTCELELTPGVFNGEHYDAVQRNVVYNHVALVPKGRAGPDARVRMDAAAAVMADDDLPHLHSRETPMPHKIRIDGIEFQVESEQVVQAIAKVEKAHADALGAKEGELKAALGSAEKLQAKVDAQAEELKKKDAELKALPEKLKADMASRVELETQAHKVLGPKAKLDGMDPKAIRVAVLKKLSPNLKLEGRSDAYLEASYDLAIEAHAEAHGDTEDALDRSHVIAAGARADDEDTESTEPPDSKQAFEAMKKRHADAAKNWRKSQSRESEA